MNTHKPQKVNQTKENKALNDKNVEPLRFNTLYMLNCSQQN